MTHTTLNAIANRNRTNLFTGYLLGAALAVAWFTSALYLPL